MNVLKTYITGMLTVFFMAGCSSDEPSATRTGFLLTLSDGVACEVGRTVPADLEKPAVSQFQVRIVNQATQSTAYEGAFKAEVPVASGTYTLTASAGENPVLDWDQPYYWGTADATVDNSLTPVTISCKVANALLTVTYANPEEFQTHYTDYKLRVSVATRSLDIADGETRSAYFQANSEVKLTFVGTLKETGTEVSRELQWPEGVTLAAGTHTQLSLTASIPASGAVVSISKATVTDVTISQTLPNEWLPKPKVGNFNGGDSRSIDYVETADAVPAQIPLTAASPIQDIQFSVAFNDENLCSLNGEYRLSTMTDEQKQAFATAGVTLPELGGTATAFDFTHLTASLWSNAGATVTNTIKVKLSANDRESDEQTFTIHTQGPQFSVSVYPGNIWTKEFTVNEVAVTSGGEAKLKNGMVYQYSTDQSNWSNISNVRQQTNLNPNATYYVRSIYRDVIQSNIVQLKTYPVIDLENGDMESWWAEERGYYYFDHKLRVYYPWSGTSFWNTNNDYTTRYRDASTKAFSTVYKYNSFPAVSYTKTVHSGTWAAELRSTAAGRGNTAGKTYTFNKVPGELFLGDISISESGAATSPNDSYTLIPGRTYASRPTGISFYYNYTPYTTDYWYVYLALYDASDNIIAEGSMQNGEAKDTYVLSNVSFVYKDEFVTASPVKLYIYFASSIYRGDDLPFGTDRSITTWYGDTQTTDNTRYGSVFRGDDISLVYDK